MTELEKIEAMNIVRRYSFEVSQRLSPDSAAYPLSQMLRENVEGLEVEDVDNPWRKFFEPADNPATSGDAIDQLISGQASQLRHKWLKFYESCPKEDQIDLKKFHPTVEGVANLVRDITLNWERKRSSSGRGKLMSLFHKFCNTLDSHGALLKILPQGNDYISVFTGSLNAIIQASVHHQRIAEGISECLKKISHNIIECKETIDMFPNSKAQQTVAELYTLIFAFLNRVMDNLMKKRLIRMLDSFNENLCTEFDDDIRTINEKTNDIRHIGVQSSHAEIRFSRVTLERVDRNVQRADARVQSELHDLRHKVDGLLAKMNYMLEQQAIGELRAQRTLILLQEGPGLLQSSQSMIEHRRGSQMHEYTAYDIALNSTHLEDAFGRERVRLLCDPFSPVRISRDTLCQLMDWISDETSNMLWIEGPFIEADGVDNPVSFLAGTFVELIAESDIPVISYFCDVPRQTRPNTNQSPEMQGAVALASSLIRQMVELLPARFETGVDLSEARFRLLQGTTESWDDTMSMVLELATLIPQKTFCVVDSLHWLDDESAEQSLADLVQVLRDCKFKVLWTTTGRSACLLDHVQISETLHMAAPGSGTEYIYDEFFRPVPGSTSQ